jgi:hypothetical protein
LLAILAAWCRPGRGQASSVSGDAERARHRESGATATSTNPRANSGPRVLRPLAEIGSRAAAITLRPLSGVIDAAAGAGVILERRAVDRVLESDELERVLIAAIDSARLQLTLQRAFASDGVRQLVDSLFDSGLIDRFLERLLASESLWHVIDEIAASPAVTAAISQQGLGFADQVGDEVRDRSRRADDWVERTARRLARRPPRATPAGDASM